MKTFATMNGKKWDIDICMTKDERHIKQATIAARGTEAVICIVNYFDAFGMKEYGVFCPTYNFGCKISAFPNDIRYNEETISDYVENEVDRRSIAAAISAILDDAQRKP